MKAAAFLLIVLSLATPVLCQTTATSGPANVPITLDHNRIVIDVHLPLPGGGDKRVRGWVDSGNPELWVSERVAKLMGLQMAGEAKESMGAKVQKAQAPAAIIVGGMTVSLAGVKEASVEIGREGIGPGLSAEINLPSSVLRHYDVLIDYPNREFTIGPRGSVHFQGKPEKLLLNFENGLIHVTSKIDGRDYTFGLDVGAPIGFVSTELLTQLRQVHPQWPHMTGAVGIANLWGLEDEPKWELMRLPSLQFGSIELTQIVVAAFPDAAIEWLQQRAGIPIAGLMGANSFLHYQVGLDYAHSMVYFNRTSTFVAPDMDVIGLVLRPENDGRYSILGVADYEGKASVPEVRSGDLLISVDGIRATGGTMGQVWSSLEGSPGQSRTLTIEREGKQLTVTATVQRFLAAEMEKPSPAKSKSKSHLSPKN
jgi:hypothetical protein